MYSDVITRRILIWRSGREQFQVVFKMRFMKVAWCLSDMKDSVLTSLWQYCDTTVKSRKEVQSMQLFGWANRGTLWAGIWPSKIALPAQLLHSRLCCWQIKAPILSQDLMRWDHKAQFCTGKNPGIFSLGAVRALKFSICPVKSAMTRAHADFFGQIVWV